MVDELFPTARAAIDHFEPEVVYVITYQGPKVKRTITGKYVSHDLTEVLLLSEKGRFQKAPIDKIIRINYYKEGRAPF